VFPFDAQLGTSGYTYFSMEADIIQLTKHIRKRACFETVESTQHLGRRADWLARNQDNVSEWGDMSIHGLLFQ
jgi:hypothetical protein